MSGLSFKIRPVDYEKMPQFGASHLLSRLQRGDGSMAGFPILRGGTALVTSESPYLDRDALIPIMGDGSGSNIVTGESCFVVAGQQAGLLTGPLDTFLKTISVILLARSLEESSGRPHHPLFWIASEDHDLLEVNRCTIKGKRFVAGDPSEPVPPRRPQVADVSLEPHREILLDFLDGTLAEEPHGRLVREGVARSSFDNYGAFFRDMMGELFGKSLLQIDPISLRSLTAPVLADLVERWPDTRAAFEKGTAFLLELGFRPPLVEPGIFEIREGYRIKVNLDEKVAELSDGPCSLAEAAERIRQKPYAFSPNAALRPVLQDAVIPVSAFVAGPSELLYLWQIDPIYAVAGVRRAPLYPRISATFLEPSVQRTVKKAGLKPEQIFRLPGISDGSLLERSDDPDVLASVENAGETFISCVESCLDQYDNKWLRRTRNSLASQLDKLYGKIRGLLAEKDGIDRRRIEKVTGAAFPGGILQERAANPFEFVARYGLAFVDAAMAKLNPWRICHQVVEMDASGLREKRNEEDDQ